MVVNFSNYKNNLYGKKIDRLNKLKIKNFNDNITDEELQEMNSLCNWIKKYS